MENDSNSQAERRDECDEIIDDISFTPAAMRHDGFFKLTFSQKEIAAGFFREHLPAPLAAAADWDSLRPLKHTFRTYRSRKSFYS